MWPIAAGLISGGASLLGSWFSSDTSAKNNQAQIAAQEGMQQESEQFNAGQAQINRDYQTQMSNTAYQRQTADMKAAGLNPILAAGTGGGASTPSGSTASIGTPTVPVSQSRGALSGLGDAVNAALNASVTAKTVEKMTDEIANLKSQGLKIDAETKTEQERPAFIRANTAETQQDVTAKKLDRARQEWEAIKYLDLSNIPDAARKAGNIGSWGANKVSDVIAPIASSALGVRRWVPNVRIREGSRQVAPDGKSFDEFWKDRTGFGG